MICENCGKKQATERHHMFSNSKGSGGNRALYGKLLDDSRNIQMLCYDCHHNKPVKKLTEIEFCEKLGIKPRSKEYKQRQMGNYGK